MTFKQCFEQEAAMAITFFESIPDLKEGIEAKLIRKSNDPKWENLDKNMMDEMLTRKHQLPFYNDVDFHNYPMNYALPRIRNQ